MGTIDSKNIWEIDTIDRILAYSKRKENSFKFFKFDFQIASFSIQKTLKIYSDKVKMLSASTKDFWKILLNDRALIIKKNSTSKKVLKIKNQSIIFFLKKLFYFLNEKKKLTLFPKNQKFNFLEGKSFYKNYLEKKGLNFTSTSHQFYFKLAFYLKKPSNPFLRFICKKPFKTLNIHLLPVFNCKYITKFKIIFQKKISKKKVFDPETHFKKKRQILKFNKIFDAFCKFKIRNIFSNSIPIEKLENITIKKLDSNHTVLKANKNYSEYKKNIFLIKLGQNFSKIFSKISCLLVNLKSSNNFKIKVYKKRNVYSKFFFIAQTSFVSSYKTFEGLNCLVSFKKENSSNNFKKKPLIFFKRNFHFFWKRRKNDFLDIENFFFSLKVFHKESKNSIHFLHLKKRGLEINLNTEKHFIFGKKRECFFIFSSFSKKNQWKIDDKIFLESKRKKFELLKYLIFSQTKNTYKILFTAKLNKIFFLSHNKKNIEYHKSLLKN